MSNKLIKALASTHEETRQEAVESLESYVRMNGSKLSGMDSQKIWKGLYYSMWLCDGGENQANLSEELSKIFNNNSVKVTDWVKYNEAFWTVLIKEWSTIDQWRMDKYYLLIRRTLRYNFKYLNSNNWDKKYIDKFNGFMKTPLALNKNMAIPYHLCDIYLDELKRVVIGEDDEEEEETETPDIDVPEHIISIFKDLSKSHKLKTYREKIKADILSDERAQKWWLGEAEKESDDEEEEWTGFA